MIKIRIEIPTKYILSVGVIVLIIIAGYVFYHQFSNPWVSLVLEEGKTKKVIIKGEPHSFRLEVYGSGSWKWAFLYVDGERLRGVSLSSGTVIRTQGLVIEIEYWYKRNAVAIRVRGD